MKHHGLSFSLPALLIGLSAFFGITLSDSASVAAQPPSSAIRPESFVGIYSPSDGVLNTETIPGIREVSIRVDKTTNTLFLIVLRAEKEDDEGKPLLPPFANINLEPVFIQTRTSAGCRIFDQTSFAEANRIVSKIDETFKTGCWIRTQHRHTEMTLRFSLDAPEEIQIGVGEKANMPTKIFRLKRISSATEESP